jgi:TIR domain
MSWLTADSIHSVPRLLPGDRVDGAISAQLEQSTLFVALVSPDYLASRYCYEKEFERALALAQAGRMRIVPVILEPCDWLS